MNEMIESDFEVTLVAQNEKMFFFGAAKELFYHFVFTEKTNDYDEINQYYIHRFELANWLYNLFNKDGEFVLDLPESGIRLTIENPIDLQDKKLSDDSILVIKHNNNTIYFPLKENSFGEMLLKDCEFLTEVYADSVKKPFRKKIISKIIETYDETITYPFSLHSLIIAAFESKVLKTKNNWRQNLGAYRLLKSEFNVSSDIDPYLVTNVISKLPSVVGKKTCDCNNIAACFFDLLYKAYSTFFNEKELLTNEFIDEIKVEKQFHKIWNDLSVKERAVIDYLDYEFGNTPLLNLYLFTPNANIQEYIYKMTYPYQPDSEDDAFVRITASLVWFYLKCM
ncbi:hypothetical protein [Flavobacterium chungnamense]|uniref:Uncharacterized protein n=1 Tax=Flavobacterium chungnamense TaxID=706182 RepID=A0ABP7UUM9_9FLAO